MSNFGIYKCKRKYHFIYKTTNLINGRYYYGIHSTDDVDDNYLGSGHNLWKSIRKYGKQNFKREIVEFCKDREELVTREKEIVNLNEIAKKDCLNIALGGASGGFGSEQHQRKCSKGRSKAWKNKEKRQQAIEKQTKTILEKVKNNTWHAWTKHNTFTNRHHSKETKQKIGLKNSKYQQGEGNSQFGTCWITNGIKNKKLKTQEIPDGWIRGRN